ncbi:MAG TPA: hypothetical protein VGL68_01820 [Solirubrobacteraceae bacterium]
MASRAFAVISLLPSTTALPPLASTPALLPPTTSRPSSAAIARLPSVTTAVARRVREDRSRRDHGCDCTGNKRCQYVAMYSSKHH